MEWTVRWDYNEVKTYESKPQCTHCLKEGKDIPAEYFVWYVGYSGIYAYLCAHHLALEVEKGENTVYEARNIAETKRLIEKRRKKR